MTQADVQVEQVDREAARGYLKQGIVSDSHPLVALLARHRQQSILAHEATRPKVDELVEALPYQAVFNAIADAVDCSYGISVAKFQASLRAALNGASSNG